MTEAAFVRSFLVVYALSAAFAVWLIWMNAAATDALKNATIAVASALPLLVAALPYLSRERTSARFDLILIYDSQEKCFATGNSWNAYQAAYSNMFTNLAEIPDATKAETLEKAMENKGLDIIEKGILEGMLELFFQGWDLELSEHPGPVGTAKSYHSASTEAQMVVPIDQLRAYFEHNKLITQPGVLVFSKLVLPPDTDIRSQPEPDARTIILTNPLTKTVISIHPSMAIVAQRGVWGVVDQDITAPNRYYTISYEVSVTMTSSLLKRYAPKMKPMRRWFTVLTDRIASFDWKRVETEIEHSRLRDALSKSLDGR